MKRKLQLLGLLVVMLTTSFSAFAYVVKVDGLCYNIAYVKNTATLVADDKNYVQYTGDITIPASVTYGGTVYPVTAIGDYAFTGCSRLTSVTIPNSVTSIGEYAFYDCTGLTSIAIPDSVTSTGYCAFDGCSGLTSITLGNSVTSIGDCAFYGCSGLTSVTIPNSVTSIGFSAFYGCSGLTYVNLGNNLQSIGCSTFYGCSGLTSITLGNSVTSIGDSAFYGCSGLTSVTIPDAVTSIDNSAFMNCSGLTSFTIGKNVESIGPYAFYGCSAIVSLYAHPTTPPEVGGVMSLYSINKSECTLYVPNSAISAYKSASQWRAFYNIQGFAGVGQIVCDDDSTVVGRYDINGRVMNEPFKGLNILKMSDGTTRKVWVE